MLAADSLLSLAPLGRATSRTGLRLWREGAEALARRAFYAGARAALEVIDGQAEDLPVDAEPSEDQVAAAEARFVRMLEELDEEIDATGGGPGQEEAG